MRANCKRCLSPLTRCHCTRGNRPSRAPSGGEALVQRYRMPQSQVRRQRAEAEGA